MVYVVQTGASPRSPIMGYSALPSTSAIIPNGEIAATDSCMG